MGKWFLDFSFWTRGYRTAQCTHCALYHFNIVTMVTICSTNAIFLLQILKKYLLQRMLGKPS